MAPGRSLTIPTHGMPDGPAFIHAFAENDLGAVGRVSLAISFDSSPPQIVDPRVEIRVDPDTGALLLSVTTKISDSDVESVWIDIVSGDEDPVRLPLFRNGTDVFSGNTNITSVAIAWSITAIDLSGNSAVFQQDGAANALDAPGHETPAPGWLLPMVGAVILNRFRKHKRPGSARTTAGQDSRLR